MSTLPPTQLSDADLIAAVTRFAGVERGAKVQLIAHLAEFDARDLHLREGFPSLFAYCCNLLHLSEHESYSRIEAARASRRFPAVLEALAEGLINLTTIRLLVPRLTDTNHRELLAAASHLKKREVEELIAERFPLPALAPSIRKERSRQTHRQDQRTPRPLGDPTPPRQPAKSRSARSHRGPPWFSLAHPTATRSASPRPRRRATSSAWRRISCGTRFRPAIQPRSSIGHWTSCSRR